MASTRVGSRSNVKHATVMSNSTRCYAPSSIGPREYSHSNCSRDWGMVLAPKGPLGFSPDSPPPDTGWKPCYATLLSGVSSDLSKCFLRGVPRAHRYHATVLV